MLEGIAYTPDGGGPFPAAVLCHHHPLFGGQMHNKVIVAVARQLALQGVASLRFNFRGVGASQGTYGQGEAEVADVAGAVDWLRGRPVSAGRPLFVIGFSFGALVGLRYAGSDPSVTGYVGVGFPAALAGGAAGRRYAGPKFFLTGEHDETAPLADLRPFVAALPGPSEIAVFPGGDHLLMTHGPQVGEMVGKFVATLV